MKNIFTKEVTEEVIGRIKNLNNETQPLWGKMSVSQMLAHCCVTYEMAFEDKHPKPNFLMRLMLKAFVKHTVVGPKPYAKNSRTAPAFLITDLRDFETEKVRLIAYLKKTQELGESHFDGRESLSFGKLSSNQWNAMFYKHLDHHLTQFGV
ncbi:DUF1569 domain-containing protein [Jiulongibacter sediminis]|uniref:DUF1569 domain-containing protein n=1 Tax=Jiulongibacter sediminis TaxID=1605367 RepID=A0A0P7CAF9_9BACT|nr:DUF1569 domain-containing protein [Jiulongibacter sediminis]KPM49647.1 hypothetical protein AFM12_03375 [Jiulongibacter sediminis]TBX26685.1 hypothetical protein TK44_03380 [Jiulongibacter sediminis]